MTQVESPPVARPSDSDMRTTTHPPRPSEPRSSPPPVREEALRLHQLQVMKRRATALLVVMTGVFVVITVFGHDRGGWVGYARALAEASMIGGLADWFAVTALFHRPLGLPIPHTAVIAERKDQFGETLGSFVQENFLSPDTITDRIGTAQVATRAADWLSDPAN